MAEEAPERRDEPELGGDDPAGRETPADEDDQPVQPRDADDEAPPWQSQDVSGVPAPDEIPADPAPDDEDAEPDAEGSEPASPESPPPFPPPGLELEPVAEMRSAPPAPEPRNDLFAAATLVDDNDAHPSMAAPEAAATLVATIPPGLRRLLVALLVIVALGAVASLAVIAVAHIDDRYEINHVAGAWIALTKHADEGTLYPPLYDEQTQRYGGTRFMPIRILLNTAAARFTGEYVRSGKLVSAGCAVLLALIMFIALSGQRCGFACALALVAVPFLTLAGQDALFSVRGDALPVALQLIAVLIAGRRVLGVGGAIAAAVFCALAVLTKISALWAPMAIGLWLLVLNRRALLAFAVSFPLLLAIGFAAFHFITDGRMTESIFGLMFAGVGAGVGPLDAPGRLIDAMEFAPAVWMLLPFAGFGILHSIARRQLTLLQLSLLMSIVVLLVLFSDSGVAGNHLIDLIVLVSVCAATPWRIGGSPQPEMTPFRGVLAVAVIGSVLAGLGAHYRTDVIEAARMIVTGEPMPRYERRPLGDIIADDDTLLSEDPYLPVAYGRLPVMLDFFMLKRIAEAHPEWGESMLERIRGAEFDYIVLLWDLDPSSRWYTEMPFATTFAHTVEQHYEYDRSVRDYNLYTPRLSGTQIEHNEDGEQLPPE